MAPRTIRLLVTTTLVLGSSSAALANDWGTFEQAQLCEKEYAESSSWGDQNAWPYPIVVKMKKGAISPACKAEIVRRAALCAEDGYMNGIYRDLKDKNEGMTLSDMCNYRAFGE